MKSIADNYYIKSAVALSTLIPLLVSLTIFKNVLTTLSPSKLPILIHTYIDKMGLFDGCRWDQLVTGILLIRMVSFFIRLVLVISHGRCGPFIYCSGWSVLLYWALMLLKYCRIVRFHTWRLHLQKNWLFHKLAKLVFLAFLPTNREQSSFQG